MREGFRPGTSRIDTDLIWQAMEQVRAAVGDRLPTSRTAERDVRGAVLALLAEEPMHGARIIREFDERSGGTWTPPAGTVYPTLQLLADEGLVEADTSGERRTWALTTAGRATVGADEVRWNAEDAPRAARLPRAGVELAQAAALVGRTGTAAQTREAAQVLDDARRRLYAILARD